jgi:hypothetical protein
MMVTVAVAVAFNLSVVSCGGKMGMGTVVNSHDFAFSPTPHVPVARLRGGSATPIKAEPSQARAAGQICHLLIDMDSVIVDWDGAFKERWIEKHPEDADLITNRKEFEFEKNFPPEKQKEIIEIMTIWGRSGWRG